MYTGPRLLTFHIPSLFQMNKCICTVLQNHSTVVYGGEMQVHSAVYIAKIHYPDLFTAFPKNHTLAERGNRCWVSQCISYVKNKVILIRSVQIIEKLFFSTVRIGKISILLCIISI